MDPTDKDEGEPSELIGQCLSNEQWAELVKLGTLPEAARPDVEGLIQLAQVLHEAEKPEAQQRRKSLIRRAGKLAAELRGLVEAIRGANVITFENEQQADDELLKNLEQYERRLKRRVDNFKSGPVTDGFHMAIQALNFIVIEHANRTLNLSENEQPDGFDGLAFAEKFFEFAGYQNKGTGLRTKVRNAVKEIVDIMGGWDEEYRPGLSPRKDYTEKSLRMGWMLKG